MIIRTSRNIHEFEAIRYDENIYDPHIYDIIAFKNKCHNDVSVIRIEYISKVIDIGDGGLDNIDESDVPCKEYDICEFLSCIKIPNFIKFSTSNNIAYDYIIDGVDLIYLDSNSIYINEVSSSKYGRGRFHLSLPLYNIIKTNNKYFVYKIYDKFISMMMSGIKYDDIECVDKIIYNGEVKYIYTELLEVDDSRCIYNSDITDLTKIKLTHNEDMYSKIYNKYNNVVKVWDIIEEEDDLDGMYTECDRISEIYDDNTIFVNIHYDWKFDNTYEDLLNIFKHDEYIISELNKRFKYKGNSLTITRDSNIVYTISDYELSKDDKLYKYITKRLEYVGIIHQHNVRCGSITNAVVSVYKISSEIW
jgi:hypothetical protein